MEKKQNSSNSGNETHETPSIVCDANSLDLHIKAQAKIISDDEEAARRSMVVLPTDERGYVLPITIPGPRAPKHEDHPAFGMRVWPPPKPIPHASSLDQRADSNPTWMTEDDNSSCSWLKPS